VLVSHARIRGPQFVSSTTGFAGEFDEIGHPAILHTDDGGRTWAVLARPCPDGTESLSGLSFATPATGLAVCTLMYGAGCQTTAVLRTSDGGRSWRVVAGEYDDGRGGVIGPFGGITAQGYADGVTVMPDGRGWLTEIWTGLFATRDAGGHWSAATSPVVDAYGGWLFADRSGLLYGTTQRNDALFRTRNAGATWKLVHSFQP
jgi:photosystem II stability/assembly factor-like uncharacterized protein